MFGSDILDVGIGLVLVYLMMSLIMTAVQESVAGIFKTRAASLEKSILQLMQGDRKLVRTFYNHPLVSALFEDSHPGGKVGQRWTGRNLPSYIPREVFAAAMVDLARGPEEGNPAIRRIFDGVDKLVGDDIRAQRRHLEQWYDGAMDRASGWYKRNTQKLLFGMTLAASIALNINSISIVQFLMVNPQQRELVTAVAAKVPPATGATNDQIRGFTDNVQELGLPIGWTGPGKEWVDRLVPDEAHPFERLLAWFMVGVGYLLTAFAVMLGAPFWFDVLNRFMVIRATVKPKEKSPDEPSEDGGGQKPKRS